MKDVVETEAFNEATIVLEKKRLLWVKGFFFQPNCSLGQNK